jgi:hypothetical protein
MANQAPHDDRFTRTLDEPHYWRKSKFPAKVYAPLEELFQPRRTAHLLSH